MPFVRRQRTYYKYIEDGEFVRPSLTANGTVGGDNFSVAASSEGMNGSDLAYKAFDGNTSGTGLDFWHSKAQKSPWWITWYNPKLVCLKSLVIYNCQYPGIKDYEIQGSNNNSSWETIKVITGATTTQKTNYTIDLSDNTKKFKYHRLYITATAYAADGYYWATVAEIGMTGTVYGVEEATSDDYDYYEDKESQYMLTRRERKYYKYIEDGEFVRPNLAADGTLGGDNFAVFATKASSSYPAYKAVDNSTDSFWQALSANGESYIFYNPKPLKVTKLDITYVGTAYGIRSGIVYGSNDNSSWTELKSVSSSSQITSWDMSDNAECYHYYKIYVVTGGADSYIVDIKNIAITATQYNVIESTPDDYDVAEEKLTPYHLTANSKIY